jgi:FKBP-type peptidyl-prolyl cis-trans isomerase FkpA
MFNRACPDASADKKLAIDPNTSMKKIGELAKARMAKAAEKQKALAKPFLEKAAAEKGAQKTASGLIYKEIKAGTGAQPKVTDIVKVHFTGTFADGKEFDSTIKRGQPIEIPLNRICPCFTEGVGMMKVGGKAYYNVLLCLLLYQKSFSLLLEKDPKTLHPVAEHRA